MLNWTDLLTAAMLSGLIFLDSAAIAQIMISQPIVCAPLIGWFLGDWQSGLLIGALLELLWIGKLPIGSHVPPEAPISALTATIIYAFLEPTAAGPFGGFGLALAIFCGIINGIIGGKLTISLRKFNNRFNVLAERSAVTGSCRGIEWLNFLSIALIWFTATMLIFFGTWLPITILTQGHPAILHKNLLNYTSVLLIGLGIAVVLDLFRFHIRKKAFCIGFGAGLCLVGILTYLFH
ncbi:MAG: PTS sugar transporter subunit IIC [bacterium]|nr:PTS sugar transporter subunit IIC [bacterium]